MTQDFNPDEFLQNIHVQHLIKRLDEMEESVKSLVSGVNDHNERLDEVETRIDGTDEWDFQGSILELRSNIAQSYRASIVNRFLLLHFDISNKLSLLKTKTHQREVEDHRLISRCFQILQENWAWFYGAFPRSEDPVDTFNQWYDNLQKRLNPLLEQLGFGHLPGGLRFLPLSDQNEE